MLQHERQTVVDQPTGASSFHPDQTLMGISKSGSTPPSPKGDDNGNDGAKHQCRDCGKEFRRVYDLNRHAKLHTGLKPHICTRCGKKFSRADALIRHMRPLGSCAQRSTIEASRGAANSGLSMGSRDGSLPHTANSSPKFRSQPIVQPLGQQSLQGSAQSSVLGPVQPATPTPQQLAGQLGGVPQGQGSQLKNAINDIRPGIMPPAFVATMGTPMGSLALPHPQAQAAIHPDDAVALYQRIQALESRVAQIPALESRIAQLEQRQGRTEGRLQYFDHKLGGSHESSQNGVSIGNVHSTSGGDTPNSIGGSDR